MSKHVKILFEIEGQDEVESVWAIPVEDGYQLDNIPFHAREVALGDVVRVTKEADGALRFDGLVRASGHSTIRLWFASAGDVQGTRDELRRLGCPSELSDRRPDRPYWRLTEVDNAGRFRTELLGNGVSTERSYLC